jgi:hypothetical protein
VAAGDFSNYQLVNSVGGMATQIVKDPLVQNAVSSTAWYRKQREKIQKEIDEGKSSPDNIYKFDKEASNWMNSPNIGEKFSGQYIPYFDIFKFAKETFDAVLPDGYTIDQVYQMGADGKPITVKSVDRRGKVTESLVYSPAMTRLEREGRFPEKVQKTITQIFSDPRVSRQLSITGEYNYRNYDETALTGRISDQKERLVADYEEKLADLNIRKNAGEDVQNEIDAVEQRMNTVNENYTKYSELVKTNPDLIRGKLYEDDVFSRYSTMFGKIVTKQQALENPHWRAQFDMQKEANEQSRFAQTEARQRYQFKEEQDYKNRALKQAWDIAVLNASTRGTRGFGVPEDKSGFTQGNQFSDTDVIYLEDKDYRDAANDFNNKSVGLVWDVGFENVPGNREKLNDQMKSGKTAEEAKYTLLSNTAKQMKIPLEDLLSQYTNKVVSTYNNLTPEQKQKNPTLVDQYKNFKNSQRNFEGQRLTRKKIDDQQAALFGKSTAKETALANVKEQKITYKGKEYDLTEDDIYDLAVYLKGNLSVLGTSFGATDEGVRRAAMSAGERMRSKGKEELLTAVLNDNIMRRGYRGGPITFATDVVRGLGGLRDVYRQFRHPGDTEKPFSEVDKVFNIIDNENFAGALKSRADIIRKSYNIEPNLKAPLFSEDEKTNKDLLFKVKDMVGGYGTKGGGRINESGDFSKFAEQVSKQSSPDKVPLSVQPTMGANGEIKVEIVAYDESGNRKGGMTIQPDEAKTIGIDLNSLYESKDISILRNAINYNGGKSSNGDPKSKSTYIQGDAWFDEDDFSQLKNSGFSAKGNVVYSNGNYYPYIYLNNGQREIVRNLPGSPSLGAAVSALLETNSTFANMLLTEK